MSKPKHLRDLCWLWSLKEAGGYGSLSKPGFYRVVRKAEKGIKFNMNALRCYGAHSVVCSAYCPWRDGCRESSDVGSAVVLEEEF